MACDREEIINWIDLNRKDIFGHVECYLNKQSIKDVIGKKYQNKLSISYLKKLDPEETVPLGIPGWSKFKLFQHREKKNVLLFQSIRSKFTSSNEYNVVVSFEELNWWFKSLIKYDFQKLDLKSLSKKYPEIKQKLLKIWKDEKDNGKEEQEEEEDDDICLDLRMVDYTFDKFLEKNKDSTHLRKRLQRMLKLNQISNNSQDENACNHWYRWLWANGGHVEKPTRPVSDFLHPIHKTKLHLLKKRRLEQYVTKQSLILNGKDISSMTKPELIAFLLQHKFHEEMYPDRDGEAYMRATTRTKASIIQRFTQTQLPKLEEEYNIDHQPSLLLEQEEEIQAMWAYKYGLLRLWLEKIYLPMLNIRYKTQPDQKKRDELWNISQGQLPYWSLDTSRLQKRKSQYWEHEKQQILKIWNKFKQRRYLQLTWKMLGFQTDSLNTGATHTISNLSDMEWIKKQIFTLYMENPVKYQLFYRKDEYPQSTHYMTEYFKHIQAKDWHDINFNLWKTPISRIQMGCSCRSGEQLPSFCCHCGTVLWLLYYAITPKDKLSDALKPLKKDIATRNNTINLLSHSNYQKKLEELYKSTPNGGRAKVCTCDNVDIPEPRIRCTVCHHDFHPTCLGQSWKELLKKGNILLQYYWKCPNCNEMMAHVFHKGINNHPTRDKDSADS